MRGENVIESWYEEFNQDLYHFLVYYNRTNDVDDLLQEVFIRAFRRYYQFEDKASPKTWLISIARRVSIDHARKKKVQRALPFQNDIEIDPSLNPEQQVLSDERDQFLFQSINQLKKNYRDVIVCRGIMDLTTLETTEVLKWSREKVDTTYFRAKKQLRQLIETQGRDLIEEGQFRSSNK